MPRCASGDTRLEKSTSTYCGSISPRLTACSSSCSAMIDRPAVAGVRPQPPCRPGGVSNGGATVIGVSAAAGLHGVDDEQTVSNAPANTKSLATQMVCAQPHSSAVMTGLDLIRKGTSRSESC